MNYRLMLIMVNYCWLRRKEFMEFWFFLGMPAIILLCRGLFGKNIWTLNFRHNPIFNSAIHRNKVKLFESLFYWKKKTVFFSSSHMNEHWMKMKEVHQQRQQQFHPSMIIKKNLSHHNIFLEMNVQKGKYFEIIEQ